MPQKIPAPWEPCFSNLIAKVGGGTSLLRSSSPLPGRLQVGWDPEVLHADLVQKCQGQGWWGGGRGTGVGVGAILVFLLVLGYLSCLSLGLWSK